MPSPLHHLPLGVLASLLLLGGCRPGSIGAGDGGPGASWLHVDVAHLESGVELGPTETCPVGAGYLTLVNDAEVPASYRVEVGASAEGDRLVEAATGDLEAGAPSSSTLVGTVPAAGSLDIWLGLVGCDDVYGTATIPWEAWLTAPGDRAHHDGGALWVRGD